MNEISWETNDKIIPVPHKKTKKVYRYKLGGVCSEYDEIEYTVYTCGVCGTIVDEDTEKYCPKCGKEIDWGNG